jgi:hypothetical protein
LSIALRVTNVPNQLTHTEAVGVSPNWKIIPAGKVVLIPNYHFTGPIIDNSALSNHDVTIDSVTITHTTHFLATDNLQLVELK